MTEVRLTDREKACVLQGFIAGLRAGGSLSDADLDNLETFGRISEQLLTGGVYNPLHAMALLRFFDDFVMPRSDLVVTSADHSPRLHKEPA